MLYWMLGKHLDRRGVYISANAWTGRFQVVVTTRSKEKGETIVESVKPYLLSYVVVEDIAKEGAFDHVSVRDESSTCVK